MQLIFVIYFVIIFQMEQFNVIICELEATLVDCGDNVQIAWLDRLNNGFSSLCEEFQLMNENEQAENRPKFLYEQQKFHSIATTLLTCLTKGDSSNLIEDEEMNTVSTNAQVATNSEQVVIDQNVATNNPGSLASAAEGAQSLALQCANSSEFGGASGKVLASTGAISKRSTPMEQEPEPTVKLPYSHYMRLMRPLISMKPMTSLSPSVIGEILRIIDQIQERATQLNYSIQHETRMIILHIQERLDSVTQHMWHFTLGENEPTLDGLIDFLVKREKFVAPSELACRELQFNYEMPSDKKAKAVCVRCQGAHFLHRCSMFRELTLPAKMKTLSDARLCINCFSSQHRTVDCKQGVCKKCGTKHNSLVCPKSN